MLTPNYNLETVQARAFALNLESVEFYALLFGTYGDLTPQKIIDEFVEVERAYLLLKSRVDAVQASITAGNDPDRFLFAS